MNGAPYSVTWTSRADPDRKTRLSWRCYRCGSRIGRRQRPARAFSPLLPDLCDTRELSFFEAAYTDPDLTWTFSTA